MRLSWTVIRILAQNDDFDILICCLFQSVKDIIHVRIYRKIFIFIRQSPAKLLIIIFLKFIRQKFFPIIIKVDH